MMDRKNKWRHLKYLTKPENAKVLNSHCWGTLLRIRLLRHFTHFLYSAKPCSGSSQMARLFGYLSLRTKSFWSGSLLFTDRNKIKTKSTPDTLKIGNGHTHLVRMETRLIWIKTMVNVHFRFVNSIDPIRYWFLMILIWFQVILTK